QDTGKLQDAFDALQSLVEDHRQSPRFTDAIQRQFEIAEEAKGGKKQRSLVFIPMKIASDDVIAMYRQIITNAPFGKYAPMAQFSIGEIYQDRGDKALATTAYQGVVDNYPNSPQAAEAQFRIGAIANIAAQRSEDASNLTSTRDALTTYVASNPSGERASEAEMILARVNEDEAAKSLEIGKFYEKQGKPKAAAIYYNEALKFGSAESSNEARTLLAKLAQTNPDAVVDTEGQPMQDFTVPAAVDLRSRNDYVGPPSPELAKLSQKPSMRTEQDDFMPIPLQEPNLPTRPGADTTPAPGMLLPPAAPGERAPLLPIPPAPGQSDAPSITPQPTTDPLLPVPPIPSPPAPAPEPAPAKAAGASAEQPAKKAE
ncbi:MAG: outer membrane protein assembly factor BamD, partial [Verrucomicrobiales bacterium]|nr:outer membrane protein assembly factor BamD [Verrucomicrobiales bacterium]